MTTSPASNAWWSAFSKSLALAGVCWIVAVPSTGLLEVVAACSTVGFFVLAAVFMFLAGFASVSRKAPYVGSGRDGDAG
jgi:hypothetical protein